MLDAPESLSKVREFCSFGYDKKYVDLAEDFTPNTHLGGHRKPLEETCFYNAVTRE